MSSLSRLLHGPVLALTVCCRVYMGTLADLWLMVCDILASTAVALLLLLTPAFDPEV